MFEKRYQKSELEHYGARVRAVRTVVKRALRSEPVRNRDELISLTEWRWRSPVHEMRLAATELPVARVGLLAPGMRGSWSV